MLKRGSNLATIFFQERQMENKDFLMSLDSKTEAVTEGYWG